VLGHTGIVVSSVPYHLMVAGFLFLGIHVSGLAVPVRILAMVISGSGFLRGIFVAALILLLGRLAVLFHRCFRLCSRLVAWLFLFLCHGLSPQKWSVPSFPWANKGDKFALDAKPQQLSCRRKTFDRTENLYTLRRVQ